jgi:hypothetical protein
MLACVCVCVCVCDRVCVCMCDRVCVCVCVNGGVGEANKNACICIWGKSANNCVRK